MAAKKKPSAATRAELRACRNLGGEHRGGPGQPDCILPDGRTAEVKDYSRRFEARDVRRAVAQPVYRWRKPDIICVTGPKGFSREAKEAARQDGVIVSACRGPPVRVRRSTGLDEVLAVGAVLGLTILLGRALSPLYRTGIQG